MNSGSRFSLEEFYDTYPRIEAEFQATLDTSLKPHGPEVLYDLVSDLRLPRGARVADVGCGEGRHSLELAERFGFSVRGIDPVPRHLELAKETLVSAAARQPELRGRVRFEHGTAEALPVDDTTTATLFARRSTPPNAPTATHASPKHVRSLGRRPSKRPGHAGAE